MYLCNGKKLAHNLVQLRFIQDMRNGSVSIFAISSFLFLVALMP